ncbi:MAG: GNAT family N-acetyltransferase [bacterium]
MHFSALEFGDEAITWRLGFTWQGRFYSYLPAFPAAMRKYLPGKVHVAKPVQAGMRNGIEVFALLTGRERCKDVVDEAGGRALQASSAPRRPWRHSWPERPPAPPRRRRAGRVLRRPW